MNNNDIYIPTKAEKRILEVALNPVYAQKNITERCKLAETSRETWYKAMRKPAFIELLNKLTLDLLKGRINDIVNATYNFATSNSKCSTDRKVLLTMAGLYSDRIESKNENVNENLNMNTNLSHLSIEEIKELLKNE